MPADVTPTSFSTSKVLSEAFDTPVQRFYEITPTSTTAFVASVNQTGEAMFGGRPIIAKTVYAAPTQSSSTFFNVSAGSITSQVTVTRVVASAPVALVTVTQYGQVVATNTTVWNSLNSPSSLLLTASDVVNYKVALVTDTVV